MEYQTTLSAKEPIAITIGNFDGVHRGHQHLMHELCVMAQELGCKPVLVTFLPHTLMVVRPDIDVQYLTTLEEKLALAKQYGHIADNIVVHFTPEVMAMSAEAFMNSLCARFIIRGVVAGANFSLGHNRQGDVTFLQHYGQQRDIQVRVVPLQETEETRISSTRIRALVSQGQVEDANKLLGHPFVMDGLVVHGNHRGRLLGFPTANLLPEPHKLLPGNGVYAVRVSVEEGPDGKNGSAGGHSFPPERESYPLSPGQHPSLTPLPHIRETGASHVYNGVVNIGVRPTFNGQERRVEAYLFDTELDLYDRRITIDFIARLRGEQRFPNVEALKAQIALDVQRARQILQSGG